MKTDCYSSWKQSDRLAFHPFLLLLPINISQTTFFLSLDNYYGEWEVFGEWGVFVFANTIKCCGDWFWSDPLLNIFMLHMFMSQFDLQIRAEKLHSCIVLVVLHQCFLWFWRGTPRLTAQICTVDTQQPLGADKWGGAQRWMKHNYLR